MCNRVPKCLVRGTSRGDIAGSLRRLVLRPSESTQKAAQILTRDTNHHIERYTHKEPHNRLTRQNGRTLADNASAISLLGWPVIYHSERKTHDRRNVATLWKVGVPKRMWVDAGVA
jgi:hypothetical protein